MCGLVVKGHGVYLASFRAAFKCASVSLQEFRLICPPFRNLVEAIITCPGKSMTTSSTCVAMLRPHSVQKQQGLVKLIRGKLTLVIYI